MGDTAAAHYPGLAGRAAIVTGGSQGIGAVVGRQLAAAGVRVALFARTQARLDEAAEGIVDATGTEAVGVSCDMASTAAVAEAVDAVAERFGRIDILVNGAAAPSGLVRSTIDEADPDLLLEDIDIKVVGYFRAAKAVTPHMRSNGYGRIVNLGGLTGRGSRNLSGLRNVALSHMTKVLSDQLGRDGITVNIVHPGVVETEHIGDIYEAEARRRGITVAEVEQSYRDTTPIGRVLQPTEIGDAVLFLASPAAAAITGESIGVDGGITRGIYL